MSEKRNPLWPALASYAVGFLWVKCMMSGLLPDRRWDTALFTAVFFLWGGLTLRKKGPVCRESVFFMVCAGLISLCFAFDRCRATEGLAFLALHSFAAYWVVCRAGLLTEGATGPCFPLDALAATVLAPFGGFFLRSKTVVSALRQRFSRDRRSWLISAAVIALAVPVLALAAGLLGQADAAFGAVWEKLTGFLRWELTVEGWNLLFQLLLSLPVGAYLWGLLGTCLDREKPWFSGPKLRKQAEGLRQVPEAGVMAVLGGFIGLYLLFFGVQAGHLCGAFFGRVPGTLTAAQYAREGFFQLCAVMAINFGLLVFGAKCCRAPFRQHRGLKAISLTLLAQSLLLAVTAAARLGLYITRFGFTPRRLLGVWAVTVLSAGCVLAIATICRPRKVVGKWLLFAAGTFSLLCLY